MRTTDNKAGMFILGASLGALAALLFAPRAGRETRVVLKQKANSMTDSARQSMHRTSDKAKEAIDRAHETVVQTADKAKDAADKAADRAKDATDKTTDAADTAMTEAARSRRGSNNPAM